MTLALLARLGYVLVSDAPPLDPGSDAPAYVSIARHLLAGDGFVDTSHNLSPHFPPPVPSSFWSPGYPAFLSACFLVAGADNFTFVRVVQACLGVVTCLLAYALAARLFSGWAAAVALLVACFYPPAIYYANVIGTETLFALVVVLGVLAVDRYADRPSPRDAALVGAVWGAGVLTNAVALAFIPWVALFLCLPREGSSFRCLWIAAAAFLLILAPWTVRNTLLHGRVVVLPTKAGFDLLVGNNPAATGAYAPLATELGVAFVGMTENEMARQATTMAVGWIRSDPKRFLALAGAKVARTWTPYPNARRAPALVACYLLSYGTVMFGAIVTALQQRRRWRRLWLPYALCLSLTVVVSIYFGASRFRVPMDALLVVVAAPAILQALAVASRHLVSMRARFMGAP